MIHERLQGGDAVGRYLDVISLSGQPDQQGLLVGPFVLDDED